MWLNPPYGGRRESTRRSKAMAWARKRVDRNGKRASSRCGYDQSLKTRSIHSASFFRLWEMYAAYTKTEKNGSLVRPRRRWLWGCGLDSAAAGWGPLAVCFEFIALKKRSWANISISGTQLHRVNWLIIERLVYGSAVLLLILKRVKLCDLRSEFTRNEVLGTFVTRKLK